METIIERVKSIMNQVLSADTDKIHPDTDFVHDLNIDSLDRVELLMGLEQEFGIKIPEEEAEKINTVGELVKCIESKNP